MKSGILMRHGVDMFISAVFGIVAAWHVWQYLYKLPGCIVRLGPMGVEDWVVLGLDTMTVGFLLGTFLFFSRLLCNNISREVAER